MNILIVEDDPIDMKLLSVLLNSSGHHVLGSGSVKDATQSIKSHKPEIIVLDLNLPGIDGLELARGLKADLETCRIPIVAITASPERFSRREAIEAGCDAYIIKPINTRELPVQIASVTIAKPGTLGRRGKLDE